MLLENDYTNTIPRESGEESARKEMVSLALVFLLVLLITFVITLLLTGKLAAFQSLTVCQIAESDAARQTGHGSFNFQASLMFIGFYWTIL